MLFCEGLNEKNNHKALVFSAYKESCNNKPMYGYMSPNLRLSPTYAKYSVKYRVFTITMLLRDPYTRN